MLLDHRLRSLSIVNPHNLSRTVNQCNLITDWEVFQSEISTLWLSKWVKLQINSSYSCILISSYSMNISNIQNEVVLIFSSTNSTSVSIEQLKWLWVFLPRTLHLFIWTNICGKLKKSVEEYHILLLMFQRKRTEWQIQNNSYNLLKESWPQESRL